MHRIDKMTKYFSFVHNILLKKYLLQCLQENLFCAWHTWLTNGPSQGYGLKEGALWLTALCAAPPCAGGAVEQASLAGPAAFPSMSDF